MASRDEVQAMMLSITKMRNDVESRLNKAMDMMERNLELDQKQKQLLNDQKTKLAITERELSEKIEFQFEKMESRLNTKQEQEQKAQLAVIQKLLTEKMETQFQKEFEEYKRKSEENYQQQLRTQGEELKKTLQAQVDEIRKIISSLPSGSTDSHKLLSSRVEQSITTSVTPPATTATNNLERPGPETKGFYIHWFLDEELFIPLPELNITATKLQNLDITVEANKATAMVLIDQLISSKITVKRNIRFPLKGNYVHSELINKFRTGLKNIDNDCVNVNYNNSKSVIFNEFVQIGNDRGWGAAHTYAWQFFIKIVTTPQSRLDQYLWLLRVLLNIEKDKNHRYWFYKVYNVTSFEKTYQLTWKKM